MNDENAIVVSGLKKSFRVRVYSDGKRRTTNYEVLKGIDLEIKKGDVVGILGKNGSGKSTFLKIISEIIEPSEGMIEIDGKVASILELNMGFHDDLTGRENVLIRGKMYGLSSGELKKKLDSIIEYAEIGQYADVPVRTYSSGMKSRLAFAIMINVEADIYVIDEALSIGDSSFNLKASAYMKKLTKSGKTVLITSHSTYSIRNICSRAVVLEDGVIKYDGNVEEACAIYDSSPYGNQELLEKMAKNGSPNAQYRIAKQHKNEKELYEKELAEAALGGNVDAITEYGDVLLEKGEKETAIEFYRYAAKNRNKGAMWRYAKLMSEFEEEKLFETMRFLSDRGDHYDLHREAMLILKTSENENGAKKAFKLFSKAADEGNPHAKYEVALMTLDGIGTEISVEKGIRILEKLADDGYLKAAIKLSNMYFRGIYTERNPKKYFEYELKLAKMGIPESQFKIAMMYQEGSYVEKDEKEAEYWFGKYTLSSLSSPLEEAAVSTLDFDEKLPLDTMDVYKVLMKGLNSRGTTQFMKKFLEKKTFRDPKTVFERCKEAAETLGSAKALLAHCYLRGIGTEPDMKKALELFTLAADAGDDESMVTAALMYKEGIGTEPDFEKYESYVSMAAKRRNRMAMDIIEKWKETDMNRVRKNARNRKKRRNPDESSGRFVR